MSAIIPSRPTTRRNPRTGFFTLQIISSRLLTWVIRASTSSSVSSMLPWEPGQAALPFSSSTGESWKLRLRLWSFADPDRHIEGSCVLTTRGRLVTCVVDHDASLGFYRISADLTFIIIRDKLAVDEACYVCSRYKISYTTLHCVHWNLRLCIICKIMATPAGT